jgi:hypothetical protein
MFQDGRFLPLDRRKSQIRDKFSAAGRPQRTIAMWVGHSSYTRRERKFWAATMSGVTQLPLAVDPG